jgi:glycine/D-amino acid oxidase-like deaminating enzyme
MNTTHPALAGVSHTPFWLDNPQRPAPEPLLPGATTTDLLVIGGGYSGLWAALLAKERDPDREVLLLEGREIAWAASGRNGGFCDASLTHGYDNGAERWPDEMDTLERLGLENLDAIESTVDRYKIDCDFRRSGEVHVATEPHQVEELLDHPGFLTAQQVRADLDSPKFLAGARNSDSVAMLDPARLAWGLKRACLESGVRIHEHTPVLHLDPGRRGPRTATGPRTRAAADPLTATTPRGKVTARHIALGTNAFPSPLRRLRPFTVPVYDYALMTEPLDARRLAAIGGWRSGAGFSDTANQFHYFRITADHRILWGGYDAIQHFAGRVRARHDRRSETFDLLARHFFEYFPQLTGLRFSHAWGGAIDTSTRFTAFFGTAHLGRTAYALGYTGLGVGATRFGAGVMLDLLDGHPTEATELEMVRRRPKPFPPEPVRWAGIELTRRSLAAADRNEGRRNRWLRALDRLGMGFDS